jgi:aldose 1-epimerase
MRPASGQGYRISYGRYEADIASVGASLRSLRYDGVDLILPFDEDEIRPSLRGAVLAPWPNRTADGEYDHAGRRHRLPLNEPELGNAAHGLVAWLDFHALTTASDHLHLTATIEPQPGYPWRVRIDVAYRLSTDGLSEEVTATNESADAAPVGLGGHPYLVAGEAKERRIDDLRVSVPADEVLLVSDRLLPVELVRVTQVPDLDRREGRPLRGAEINHAYTRLSRVDGIACVAVVDAGGSGVEIAWDDRCPWVQIYTADHGDESEFRQGVAVEPMTCPPDALNSKRDLAVVPPGESVSAGWTIRRLDG